MLQDPLKWCKKAIPYSDIVHCARARVLQVLCCGLGH
jgi:hypothetical protein